MEGLEKGILREIRQENQRGDQEEPVAKATRELRQAASKTVCSMEWSEEEGLLQFRDKIYVPWNADLQRRVVSLCHNTKVARHPRRWKTLELVSRDYWWPQMSRYIGQYISTCDLCLRTKPTRQALVGELHPLRILDLRWDTLSIDFVVELPSSSGVRDVRSGSGVTQNGTELPRDERDLTTKVGEQPWPQLVRCASIDCCTCDCVFQEN